jgi:hypothetical protein
MKFLKLPLVLGMMLSGCLLPVCAQNAPAQKDMKALDPKLMDTSVDPYANFYQY